jgi:hypothetical protein
MIRGLADENPRTEARSVQRKQNDHSRAPDSPVADYGVVSRRESADQMPERRRTPRVSVVVILPEHHTVSPESLLESLRSSADREVDVLVACAGQPTNLGALQRCVRDAQFLLAPAGTSPEQLRELAMEHASGDIVTLLSGAILPAAGVSERPLFKTS